MKELAIAFFLAVPFFAAQAALALDPWHDYYAAKGIKDKAAGDVLAQSGSIRTQGKPMDKSMCEEMMKDHMGMMGKDHMDGQHKGQTEMMGMEMPKECMQMMEKHGMAMKGMSGDKAAQGMSHKGVGVVKKVDTAGGKVTLQHEPVASAGWPAMTMVFTVKDKSALGKLQTDQKVEFDFVKEGSDYAITSIKSR